MSILLAPQWDEFLSRFPDAHVLQTCAWGELKAAFGWGVARIASGWEKDSTYPAVGAQILFRKLPFGFRLAYIPKGPVGEAGAFQGNGAWQNFWPEVDALCREQKAVFLKVEPDEWQRFQAGVENDSPSGFQRSQHSIQPARTLVVDITGDEDCVLSRMKQKTRYNIRLALKKGVLVRSGADVELFYRLMKATGERDGFGVHSLDYFRRAYELFNPRNECELFFAEYQGEPLAALMVFSHGKRAWYFYGASLSEHRERMPTYLLQWEAIRWARAHACTEYDLWGVPDADLDTLESNFERRGDGLWGVYRFKRGFGGHLRRAPGPWDRIYNRPLYTLYRWWMSRRAGEGA